MTTASPATDLESLLGEPGALLIDSSAEDRASTAIFSRPREVIVAVSGSEVENAIMRLDAALRSGYHAAGYLAYEAGVALNRPRALRHTSRLPLVWLGLYEGETLTFPVPTSLYARLPSHRIATSQCVPTGLQRLVHAGPSGVIENLSINLSRSEYRYAVRRIKKYIEAGDVYQVNFTCKLRFALTEDPFHFFARLRCEHPVGYAAYLNLGDFHVISLSPELFLLRRGQELLSRPMKGTAPRGRWTEEDSEIAKNLALDEKNRAENLMIVDLMRNDIGRVCEYGSVWVPTLFRIERYPTLWQMTSDVKGVLRSNVSVSEILRAVLPPGSVTGTPKLRAIEIISELEPESRGPYCGCIGVFRPDGDFSLNVAIRTVVKERDGCELGIGGAVVADSIDEAERNEALTKSRFLFFEPDEFRLLETLLFRRDVGYVWKTSHLERMLASADYFGWQLRASKLSEALDEEEPRIRSELAGAGRRAARVRLLVDRYGVVSVEWSVLELLTEEAVTLELSESRTDPANVFLYHKTTKRELYDSDFANARSHGRYDVLYLNAKGEVTECSRANIVAYVDGAWKTPPVYSGLLPGLWRRLLIESGLVVEEVIRLEDLLRAEAVAVGNSVRGAVPVGAIETGSDRLLSLSAPRHLLDKLESASPFFVQSK